MQTSAHPSYTFTYPLYFRLLGPVGCLLFGGLFALSLSRGYSLTSQTGLISQALIALGLFVFYWFNRRIEVDEQEIKQRDLLGRASRLRWADIAIVKSGALDPSLTLSDQAGSARVIMEPLLDGYTELVGLVRRQCPTLWSSQETTFHRTLWMTALGVLLACVFLIPGVRGLVEGQMLAGLFLLGLGIFILVLVLRAPQRVTLEGATLHVKYLVGERSIRADEIQDIQLRLVKGIGGEHGASVLVILANRRQIDLAGFSVGVPVLHNALLAWWQKLQPPTEL